MNTSRSGHPQYEPTEKKMKQVLEVQRKLGAVKFDRDNPRFRSKYVSLDAIWQKIRPVLNEHNVIVSQSALGITEKVDNGFLVSVKTTVTVVDEDIGVVVDEINTSVPIMDQTTTNKDGSVSVKYPDAQSVGAAITYAKRYALVSYFGLVGTDREDDDDGNSISTDVVELPPQSKMVDEIEKRMLAAKSKDELLEAFNAKKHLMTNEQKERLGSLGKKITATNGWNGGK